MTVLRLAVILTLLPLAACSGDPPSEAPTVGSEEPASSASAAASTPTVASPTGEAVVGGRLAFLRDGELVVRDFADGSETETGIEGVTPIAFALDEAAVVGYRSIPDNPHVVSVVLQPLDGADASVLVQETGFGAASPSPDGRRLAFGTVSGPPGGLVVVDLETGEARQLTQDGAYSALWSPDSRTIAYAGVTESLGSDLFVVDVASGATRQLTNDEWEDDPFRWSENGRSILTTSHRGGDGTRLEIFVWEVDATDGTLIQRPDLAWNVTTYELPSPDGRWAARVTPQNNLRIVGEGLGAGTRLGPTDPSVHLTWAPNSAWLVWTAFDEATGNADLMIVHAPNGTPTRLTRTPESESHPVWGPSRHGF